jgi:tRNA (adenine57-N1/adenine58-N1)-methyltransferase catalytic subunit
VADVVEPGDRVLIWHPSGRRFLMEARPGTHRVGGLGVVRGESVLGKPWGEPVRIGDQDYWFLRPTLRDHLLALERRAQIITPKDASRIVLECGIGPGQHVAEAGVGSAGLTLCLAHHVGPNGRIYGYDIRDDHLKVARSNLLRSGLLDRVELKQGDVADESMPRPVDALILDVPDPERVIPKVWSWLARGATLACYTPLVVQMERARKEMTAQGAVELRSMEILERSWTSHEQGSRPETSMLGHTGFLTFGRRL